MALKIAATQQGEAGRLKLDVRAFGKPCLESFQFGAASTIE